jgi:hypothetical protein
MSTTEAGTPQDGLEAALAAAEARVEAAQREAAAVSRELKKARAAAAVGQVRDLRRALTAAVEGAQSLAQAAKEAEAAYAFDETDHLASGAYARELLAAAADVGLAVVEDDDRLLCYPSLVRVLPGDAALDIDRRRERRLRPSTVVGVLAAAQARPPKGKPEALLESLVAAYELLAQGADRPDPVLRLDALWSALTMLPGAARDYSKPEFARDLYLLDQSATVTTRSGRTLRFHASSGTRGAGVLTTVAKTGQQQRYWGVSFTAGQVRDRE